MLQYRANKDVAPRPPRKRQTTTRYTKEADIGDAILRIKPLPVEMSERVKEHPPNKVNWGAPMPFERRKFNPELTRNRGAASI